METNKIYRIEVNPYMTKKATANFDFMKKFNGDIPMPKKTMTGKVLSETPKMVKMKLWDEDKTWEGYVVKSAILKCADITEPLDKEVSVSISYGKTIVDLGTDLDVKNRAVFLLSKFPVKETNGNCLYFSAFDFLDICAELEQLGLTVKRNPGNFLESLLVPENKVSEIEAPTPESLTDIQLFPYQKEGVEYGLAVDRFLLADEMGLGKTIQGALIAAGKKSMFGFKHCLVICGVNSVKYNWVKEVNEKTKLSGMVLAEGTADKLKQLEMLGHRLYTEAELNAMGKRDRAKAEKSNEINQAYFLVTNMETFRNESVVKKMEELCRTGVIGGILFDEIHKCVNSKSKQSKGILELKAKFKVGITGTPLVNRPTDAYFLFKWLEKTNKDMWGWNSVYQRKVGEYDYEFRNLEILKQNFDRIMLRREKKNVLDLPEKVFEEELIEMNEAQAELYKRIALMPVDDKNFIGAVKVLRLRQVTGSPNYVAGVFNLPMADMISAKLERLVERVQELVESGQKVVIFSNWIEMLDAMEGQIGDVLRVDKNTPMAERHEIEKLWLSEEEYTDIKHPVIIGTIKAMGTGMNLQTASNVIFFDEPWTSVDRDQAVDRCHRVGTKRTVNVYTLMMKDTVDEGVHDVVTGKKTMADFLLGYGASPEDIEEDDSAVFIPDDDEALSDCEIEMLL